MKALKSHKPLDFDKILGLPAEKTNDTSAQLTSKKKKRRPGERNPVRDAVGMK
jgi:hypothetical protein